jgi:hypothetical protein
MWNRTGRYPICPGYAAIGRLRSWIRCTPRTKGKPTANRSRRIFGNYRNKLTAPSFSGANPYTPAKCLKMPTPEYYRKKAEEMRRQAQRAATAELGASYLAIAEDWDRLARDADAAGAFSEREDEPSTKR